MPGCGTTFRFGPFGRHPDFVALHPQQGIVVLEVKDWRLDTIVHVNRMQVELLTDSGNVSTDNPFEQVRSYMFSVVDTLNLDPSVDRSSALEMSHAYMR
jgi:hypothetical protein